MPKRPRERQGEALKVVTLDVKSPGPLEPTLESFINPIGREEFFSGIYQQRALVIKCHPKSRDERLQIIRSLMENFNPTKMLEQSNSESISVWMKGLVGGQEVMNSIKVGPEEAKKCYDSGHSLYFRGSEALESSLLPAMASSVGYNLGANFRDGLRKSEIEVFAAHVGHQTGWHFDFQENFTVQLRGAKKWYLRTASVENPHRACALHFTDAGNVALLHQQHQVHRLANPTFCGLPPRTEEECETVILQAGDILYHPAGIWHKVEAVASPDNCNSLSINMSFFPTTWAELVTESLSHAMMAHSHWRERIRFESAAEGRAILADRLKKLQEEVAKLKPVDILPDIVTVPAQEALHWAVIGDEGKVTFANTMGWKSSGKDEKVSNPKTLWRRNPLGILSLTEPFFSPPLLVSKSELRAINKTHKSDKGKEPSIDDEEDDDDEEEEIDEEEEEEEMEELEDSEEDESDEESSEQKAELPLPAGFKRYDYHSNFIVEDGLPGAPAVHVVFFVHADVVDQFSAASQLSPTLPAPIPTLSHDVRQLLLHIGYLTPSTV